MSREWTKQDLRDQSGKIVIVTGGNSGIGYEASKALAGNYATVVLAVRNVNKGREALDKIKYEFPNANIHVMKLDLNDLESVKEFSREFRGKFSSLSLLINNAGIMAPTQRITKDGFESQFGVNYLGHFALTGLLIDLIIKTPDSRVISVGSLAAHNTKPEFKNFKGTKKKVSLLQSYAQSKLACMFFAKELQYRFRAKNIDAKSVACHPGIVQTYLFGKGSGKLNKRFTRASLKLIGQSAELGAYPLLYAATEHSIRGGEYIGPDGRKGIKGFPTELEILDELFDEHVSNNLWILSEKLTGVTYKF
ncbi:SDR family NAD(P)-dependent oxidoreductase [Lysinibacillus yapensis]|uniref:SDR family NAD(P)-dependent oxidoreductase n=1 Tax=Ureibacillus yapensis TaxID=2304605 RepID=A0A396SF11_9BACL|nr:oxidoreductase [Lysinibacillus yapensis]RHW37438.1 SDR family NAD(P)-dependent oxidoreductase [Lysinibacillus yapensis]